MNEDVRKIKMETNSTTNVKAFAYWKNIMMMMKVESSTFWTIIVIGGKDWAKKLGFDWLMILIQKNEIVLTFNIYKERRIGITVWAILITINSISAITITIINETRYKNSRLCALKKNISNMNMDYLLLFII